MDTGFLETFVMNKFSLKILRKLLSSPLIAGSVVFFIGAMFTNVGNYIYHLLMGRMLGPEGYGEFTSLISLAYMVSIIATTLLTTVVKFVSKYKSKKNYAKIFWLFVKLTRVFLVIGLGVFLLFVVSREEIAKFLNLSHSFPVILTGAWMFLSFLSFINEGILRSFFKFGFLSLNTILATTFKLILAYLLVNFGYYVSGAMGAILLGSILPYLISFYPLRFLWQHRDGEKKVNWNDFAVFTFPVLLTTLGLTSLYSSDVILVKHFFSSYDAGLYSCLAMLGKIIFFASSVIPAVMFPIVAERHEKGEEYKTVLKQSLLLVGGCSLAITFIYFVSPELMIRLLYGHSYLEAARYLGFFGVFITIYSICSLLANYFLSIGKVTLGWLPVLAAFLQVVLIWFFHNSISQVVFISTTVAALLLTVLLLYYFLNGKRKRSFSFSCHTCL